MRHALCLAGLMVAFLPAAGWAQTDESGARVAFERGSELSDAGQYAEAISAFRESHRLNPGNASPLFAIGVCQMEMGEAHFREALETLERYVAAGHNPERHEEARHRIRTLLIRLGLGTLRVLAVPPDTSVSVDGETVAPARYGRIRLSVGAHTVVAAVSGRDDDSRQVNIAAGELTQLSFAAPAVTTSDPDPSAPDPEPDTTDPPLERSTTDSVPAEEPVESPDADIPPEEEPEETVDVVAPRRSRWWIWTIIGAAVLGGVAVGLGVGLSNPDPPDGDWRVEVP